jgi:biopolymer transport protein ExbD
MHGGSARGGKKRARIEIIPLIDIIFFLLATFMMVMLSMTKNQGVQVSLPGAGTASSLGDQASMEDAVSLSVTEKGDLFYNKEPITIQQLPMRLQALKTAMKDKEPKIIINGDASANYKHVAAVMDAVRNVGIQKVGINTDKR